VPEPEVSEDGVGAGVRNCKARLQLVRCATSVVHALISEGTELRRSIRELIADGVFAKKLRNRRSIEGLE